MRAKNEDHHFFKMETGVALDEGLLEEQAEALQHDDNNNTPVSVS